MSNAPTNDLGTTAATVKWIYDNTGEQEFLASQQRLLKAQERFSRAQTGGDRLQLPTDELTRQVRSGLQQLTQEVSKAKPFAPLTRELAEATAQIERRFQELVAKRDSLRSIIESTGLSSAERRKFFDNQGRSRSNTDDDQRYDLAFENASRATSLSRSEGDPNSVRAEIEKAEDAAVKLRGVLAEIRSLKDQGAGSKRGMLADEYIEAARAAEQFGRVAVAAREEQAAAQQRVTQTEGRTNRLSAIVDDETQSEERRARAWGLAAGAAQQLTDAQERLTAATQQVARAEGSEKSALDALTAAQANFNRTRPAGTRERANAAANAIGRSATNPADLTPTVAPTANAFEQLDEAVTQYIAALTRADAATRTHEGHLDTLRAAIVQVTESYDLLKTATAGITTPTGVVETTALLERQITAANRLVAALNAAHQLQGPASVTTAELQAAARVQSAKLAADAKIEQQRLASVARVEAAEKQAAARVQGAQITADQRVEADRLRALNRSTQSQQQQSASTTVVALPRGLTGNQGGQAALEVLGGLGLATGIGAVVQQAVQLGSESLDLANNLEDSRSSIIQIAGEAERGEEFFKLLVERSHFLGVNIQDTAAAFIPLVAGLKDMPELFRLSVSEAERLALANKAQGTAGASFAINEFLSSGQTTSIADRFNLPAAPFKKLAEETRDITDVTEQYRLRLEGVDRILNDMNLTTEAVTKSTRTNSAEFRNAGAAVTEFKTRVGETAQGVFGATARGLTNLLTGGRANSQMLQEQADIAAMAADSFENYRAGIDKIDKANRFVVGSQKELTKAQFDYLKSLPEVEQQALLTSGALTTITPAATAAATALGIVSRGAGANAELIQQARDQVQQFGAITPDVTASILALAQAFADGAIEAEEFNLRMQDLTTEAIKLQHALDAQADEHESNADAATRNKEAQERAIKPVRELSGAIDEQTIALRRLAGAAKDATDVAAALQSDFEADQQDLLQVITSGSEAIIAEEARRDTQLERLRADHNSAIDRLNTERASIEQENNDRLAELADTNRRRDERQAEDTQIADRRSLEEFNEQQQDALENYQERRQELLDQQHDREVDEEQTYQREIARATREGQVQQFNSTRDFLSQLYDLTRGRRNKAELAEARSAFDAAKAEAAQLAATDPQAAAQLLAERQRQILAGIQRKRDATQLRRDARRGGNIASADVETEIAEIDQISREADQATIDAIKTGARERQEDRDREKEERRTSNQEALDDLDNRYADETATREEARREQLQRQDEDRRLDTLRRDQDDADALQALKDANRDRLTAIDEQIAAENTSYDTAHRQVLTDFDAFKTELLGKIEEAKTALLMTPTQEDKLALQEAARTLGGIFGDAYIQDIVDRINAVDWKSLMEQAATGPSDAHDRHSEPPRNPGVTAAARAATPGGVIISDFGDDRTGVGGTGARAHEGIDVKNKYGSPIYSLTDGEVVVAGWNKLGGNFVQIRDPKTGDEYYYAHMADTTKFKKGMQVKRGQLIGRIGNSGDAAGTDPHLHLQIRHNGDWVDPAQVLATYQEATGSQQAGTPQQGASGTGSAYSGQSMAARERYTSPERQAWERMGGPTPATGRASSAVVSSSRSITLDLRGSTFGAGLTEQQVRTWMEPIVDEAFDQYEKTLMGDIEGARTRGSYTR